MVCAAHQDILYICNAGGHSHSKREIVTAMCHPGYIGTSIKIEMKDGKSAKSL